MLGIAAIALSATTGFENSAQGLHRMYVLDCGRIVVNDQSRWMPGFNAGQPREFSNSCYLFQHERGMLLWETGVPDALVRYEDGFASPDGAMVTFLDRSLQAQLEELDVTADDITYVAISHSHGDHIGNARAFMASTVLLQRPEYEAALAASPPLGADHRVELLRGDHDVFGDGSIMLLSTPGHTPGHQSLLARLPETGTVILTGDLVHFQDMWDNRSVPVFNFDRAQSLASIERISTLVEQHEAWLVIGHDKETAARLRRPPEYYE